MTWEQRGSTVFGEGTDDYLSLFRAMSLSDNGLRLAIGSAYNDSALSNGGEVYVYEWDGSTGDWTQMGSDLISAAPFSGEGYGWSVSLSGSGSRLAVGSFYSSGTSYVYVYDWDGSAWVAAGSPIAGAIANSRWGDVVRLSKNGNILAGSASKENSDKGAVYIYEWNGTSWSQKGSKIQGGATGDKFGYDIDLSEDGTRLAIGAVQYDSPTKTDVGALYVYEWDESSSSWVQMGSLIEGSADGTFASDRFGWSVGLSSDGTRVIAGAPDADGAGSTNTSSNAVGHCRVFDWNGSAWVQVGSAIEGDDVDDYMGYSSAISGDGNRIICGAALAEDETASPIVYTAGFVRIFDYDETTSDWVQSGSDFRFLPETDNQRFGSNVEISRGGTVVAMAAYRADSSTDSQAGAVATYRYPLGKIKYWDGSDWVNSDVKYWDGSDWVNVNGFMYWDGSAWA